MRRANRHILPGHAWQFIHRCHQKIFLLQFARDRRRFLLHVLPDGFMRIRHAAQSLRATCRHFGLFANRSKKQALAQCRKLLKLDAALPEIIKQSAKDLLRELTGVDLSRCPCCQKGTMIVVGELPRIANSPQWDSS